MTTALTTPTTTTTPIGTSGSISFLGSGSGLPLSSLLNQLRTNASQGLVLLQSQESSVQSTISAYGQLQSALGALSTAAQALSPTQALGQLAASVTGSDFTATVQSQTNPGQPPAVAGTYSVQVNALARAQTLVSTGQASSTAQIGSGGVITFTLGNGQTETLDMTGGDTSVQGLMQAINSNSSLGLQATMLNDGSATPYRLMISPTQSGTQAAVTNISVSGNSTLGSFLSLGSMTQQAASDAQLSVNGVAVTSASNTVSSVIPGVTLTLGAASGTTQTMTISQDTNAASTAINAFVSAYNTLQTTISSLTAFNSTTEQGSVLTGDSVTRNVQTSLSGIMNFSSIDESAFPTLGSIGILSNTDGTISVNQSQLTAALQANPQAVSQLFDGPNGLSNFTTNLINNFTDTNGSLSTVVSGANARLASLQQQYTNQSSLIDAQMATLQNQFVQLDALVATMNNTSSYLTQQFAALSKSGG